MKPKVSIITVCFNSEKTIEDTIQSVVKQDYPNLEYIIIDGNSTDSTNQIIQKFNNKISIHLSEKDNGMYDALNKGIDLASGEIIGMLNADDFYIDKQVISDMVDAMHNTKADAGYADLYYVGQDDTQKIVRKWVSGKYKRKNFLNGWMPPHPTFFLKKSAYEIYGKFNLDFKSAADYELMLRLLYKYGLKAAYLARVVVKMRVGGMSNVSLINRIKANKEDRKAWKANRLKPRFYTLYFKPLQKVGQYLNKKSR